MKIFDWTMCIIGFILCVVSLYYASCISFDALMYAIGSLFGCFVLLIGLFTILVLRKL